MTEAEWLAAREAEIKELEPLLLCRQFVADAPPGQPVPCNALTPSSVAEMLWRLTGWRVWRVAIVGVNLLEVLPPHAPSELEAEEQ